VATRAIRLTQELRPDENMTIPDGGEGITVILVLLSVGEAPLPDRRSHFFSIMTPRVVTKAAYSRCYI